MRRCDICQQESETTYPIREEFRQGGLKDICHDCEAETLKVLSAVSAALDKFREPARRRAWLGFLKGKGRCGR